MSVLDDSMEYSIAQETNCTPTNSNLYSNITLKLHNMRYKGWKMKVRVILNNATLLVEF